jgi:hypothetical protein
MNEDSAAAQGEAPYTFTGPDGEEIRVGEEDAEKYRAAKGWKEVKAKD